MIVSVEFRNKETGQLLCIDEVNISYLEQAEPHVPPQDHAITLLTKTCPYDCGYCHWDGDD